MLGCAYVVGFSNVQKLGGAAFINDPGQNPTITSLAVGPRVVYDFGDGTDPAATYLEVDSLGSFDPPPSAATFLTFGFMPTTATMDLSPTTPLTIVTAGQLLPPYEKPTLTRIYGGMMLRISDVKVNGTPLAVGPRCRTTRPIDLELTGTDPDYTVQTGGPLYGSITIPPFTGCGADEDLDPLFTGSISGGGNLLKFTQGPLCDPVNEGCPGPVVPVPQG